MNKISEEQAALNQKRFEALASDQVLLKKVIRVAQFESELELGVNPSCFDQADTSYLTEKDFDYIRRVTVLVEKRLKNSDWLTKTLDEIDFKSVVKRESVRGVRFDDELFKAGRGILESFLKEKYDDKK